MPTTPNTVVGSRGDDLDNLRTFLTGLVIVQHTSNCYGGPGNGPYKSPLVALAYPASRLPLFLFNAVNHSFFMGLFFWVSGRLSAQSLKRADGDSRRTRLSFVRRKLLRLGLPAVFYTLVLEPFTLLVGQQAWDTSSMKETLRSYYAELAGIRGPVWYTANLLLFDVVAALVCPSTSPRQAQSGGGQSLPRTSALNLPTLYVLLRNYGWIVTTVASFLIRIYYPVGTTFTLTALQVAFAPQYIFAYVIGFVSAGVEPTFTGPFARTHVVRAAPNKSPKAKGKHPTATVSQNRLSVITAILLSVLLVPLPYIPQFLGHFGTDVPSLGSTGIYGGWNSASFLYALWNEISFVLIGPAVASYFYTSYRMPTTSWLFRCRDSYGAFMVHMLVSTIDENIIDHFLMWNHPATVTLLRSSIWQSSGLIVMTAAVGMINVVVSFAVARFLLDTVPMLRRII